MARTAQGYMSAAPLLTLALALLTLALPLSAGCGRIGYDEADWLGTQWRFRQQVSVNAGAVSAPLDGFVVYLNLEDLGSDFHGAVAIAGADIRITGADGVRELAREVVRVDTGAGTGEVHFRADSLSPSEDTVFYVYYGNAYASAPAPDSPTGSRSVWTDGFVGAWHLEERPDFDDGCGLDRACNSVSGAHPGQISEDFDSAAQVPGLLGGALSFDGLGDAVAMPTLSGREFPQTTGTLSVLFRFDCDVDTANRSQLFDAYGRDRRHFFLRCSRDLPGRNFQMAAHTGGGADRYEYARSFWVREDDWNVVSIVYDTSSDEVAVYHDGVSLGAGTLSPAWLPAEQLFVLGRNDAGSPIGLIDEVRFSDAPRTPEWLAAEFANLYARGTFYRVGLPETRSDL